MMPVDVSKNMDKYDMGLNAQKVMSDRESIDERVTSAMWISKDPAAGQDME